MTTMVHVVTFKFKLYEIRVGCIQLKEGVGGGGRGSK